MRCAFFVLGAVFVAVALAAPSGNAAKQVTGAIFTTTADGTKVNGNIYADKNDVYLNGGPQSGCSQAGLPDGEYFYQVTDPSGKVMLSQDPVTCRTALVVNGYWTGGGGCRTAGPGNTDCCHQEVSYAGSCPGQKQDQLMPYADTPNPGGEYKAWATPVGSFDWANYQQYCSGDVASGLACGEYSQAERAKGRSFGFVDSESKTDNYKVRVADIPPPPPASASSAPSPSSNPTKAPTRTPASTPDATKPPTRTPTGSSDPTKPATRTPPPTPNPTQPPTRTRTPTSDPTQAPTRSSTPTSKPTDAPTTTPAPTAPPTPEPSTTSAPTAPPTPEPGVTSTPKATDAPTRTSTPTSKPTDAPTTTPAPTAPPTPEPTTSRTPTSEPTKAPTSTSTPTSQPTKAPTTTPSPSSDSTQAPTSTPAPTGNPTTAPTSTPAPTPDSTPPATPSAPPTECVSGGYSDNCGASSDCTRCASVSLVKKEKLETAGYAVTYRVCNRCDNNVGQIAFGLEAPVNALGQVPSQITSANGDKYDSAVVAGNPKGGQEPTFRALQLSSPKFDNKLRKGACDEFTFTINVWNPDWKQNFVVVAGQYMDFFSNIPVGVCFGDGSDCPPGLDGPDCDQCENSADYTWWCAPTGRGEYQLSRVFGSTANLPGVAAGGVDADGYQITCLCNKIYEECCADCADCNDATGECRACANPNSVLTPNAPNQCCRLPVGAVTPCGSNPCVGNSVCVGATNTNEGQCECVTFEDGSSYTGADCDTFVPPPTNQTQFCEDFDCDDCNSAFEAFGLECSYCADACRPSAFCESEQTECATGVVAFTPGYCPGDCGGPSKGTCNTTSGLCVCKGKNTGLNCGSKNGLNYAAIGGLAAGAVAGIVIASVFAVALIVGLVVVVTSYGAVKVINGADFANTIMSDSAIYDAPAGQGMSAVYEAP